VIRSDLRNERGSSGSCLSTPSLMMKRFFAVALLPVRVEKSRPEHPVGGRAVVLPPFALAVDKPKAFVDGGPRQGDHLFHGPDDPAIPLALQ
jgi:hypothetical protein